MVGTHLYFLFFVNMRKMLWQQYGYVWCLYVELSWTCSGLTTAVLRYIYIQEEGIRVFQVLGVVETLVCLDLWLVSTNWVSWWIMFSAPGTCHSTVDNKRVPMLHYSQNQIASCLKLQYLIFCSYSCRQEGGNGPIGQEPLPGPTGGQEPTFIETNWDESIESFDAMDLREELLRGIYAWVPLLLYLHFLCIQSFGI